MAKPNIYFRGAKFTTGDLVGYRPQLEAATKKKDLMLAEEIVLENRLSTSPEELLHDIQTVLEYCPRAVANDGIVREFSGLLTFNRLASGRLNGPGGEWNDTCKAYVRAQLLKDGKQLIDGRFINEEASGIPKIDNVTYIGAQEVTNCIKIGKQFAAYGRYMQFDATAGDTAYLTDGYDNYALTCASSDVAHAVFNYPSGMTLQPGVRLNFVMQSRAGVEGGGVYTSTKRDLLLLPGDEEIIGQTPDGVCKILTLKDGGQSSQYSIGHEWNATTVEFFDSDVGHGWHVFGPCQLTVGENSYSVPLTTVPSGQSFVIDTSALEGIVPAGTYNDATIDIPMKKCGAEDMYDFVIMLKVVAE